MLQKDQSTNPLYTVNRGLGNVSPGRRQALPPMVRLILPGAWRVHNIKIPAIPGNLLVRLSMGLSLLIFGCIGLLLFYCHLTPAGYHGVPPGVMPCIGGSCFHGLMPGQTPWLDAIAAFNDRSTITDDPAYAKITLFSSSQHDHLSAIMLEQPLGPPVTIGAILSLYGLPQCVSVYHNPGVLVLHYPFFHLMTRPIHNLFSPLTRIAIIVLGNPMDPSQYPSFSCQPLDGLSQQHSTRRWQGFATLDHYLRTN